MKKKIIFKISKMNFYLFDHPTYERLYNCSMLSGLEWEKRKNPNLIGVFYLILATIYQVSFIYYKKYDKFLKEAIDIRLQKLKWGRGKGDPF